MRSVGNYVLGAQIGRGATSEVFAAEHRWLGDPAAIKLLRADLAGDGAAAGAAIDELVAEAAKLRAVQHPNVVRVLDVGSDEATGRCYLAMERVDGESLAARLRREGRLAEEEVRRLGAEIADGLAAVHAAGLVHRDLKPGNVMLDGNRPKLVDFGIAKFLGDDAAQSTSRRIGTPAYMAPEQLVGGLISPAVDVWALGVLLFEVVTGRLPFEDFANGRCPQLFEAAPRAGALAAVSPALDRVIAGCLERDPGRRLPSMAAVARALRGDPGALDAEPGGERFTEDAGPLDTPPAAAPGARLAVPAAQLVAPHPPLAGAPLVPAPQVFAPPVSAPPPSRVLRRLGLLAAVGGAVAIGIAAAALVTRAGGSGGRGREPGSSAGSPESAASALARSGSAPEPAGATPAGATPAGAIPADPIPADPIPADPIPADPIPADPAPGSAAPTATRPAPGLRPPILAVLVRSSPSGAQIFVRGKLIGTTPRKLELAGPATLILRYRGYEPARVRAALPGPIDVRLVRSCAQPPCEDLN